VTNAASNGNDKFLAEVPFEIRELLEWYEARAVRGSPGPKLTDFASKFLGGMIEDHAVIRHSLFIRQRSFVLVRPLVIGTLLGSIGLLFVIGGCQASGKDASYGGMILLGYCFSLLLRFPSAPAR